MSYTKQKKMSYSKANTYDSCGWKYYLSYVCKYSFFDGGIAADIGTLIHYFEEQIFKTLKAKKPVDYDALKAEFETINIPKQNPWDSEGGIYGMKVLREKYPIELYKTNELGQSYYSRLLDYLATGIYRLEDYLKSNPNIVPWEAEKYFSITFEGYVFSGHIDRIFYDTENDLYIVEDIKTKDKKFKDEDLDVPLQFVVYCLGLHEGMDIPLKNIVCRYDLPILKEKQDAGAPGFVTRGVNVLKRIIGQIEAQNWAPNPSPLCYWCDYCNQKPEQPKGAENLCPYYSLWTPDAKTKEVASKWEGLENHERIKEVFLTKYGKNLTIKKVTDEFDFEF